MEATVAEVLIQALVLCAILYVVAKHEADYSFQKVAMVAAGIGLGNLLLQALQQDRPAWLVVLTQFGFSAFMITTFCWVGWRKSLLVVAIFCTLQFGAHLAVAAAMVRLFGSAQPALPSANKPEEVQEVRKFMEESLAAGMPKPGASSPGLATAETSEVESPAPAPSAVPVRPASVPASATSPDWAGARAKVKLGGVMSGAQGRSSVVINGQLREEGQTVSVEHKGVVYRWRLVRVPPPEKVDLEQIDARPAERP